jgi:hypothetical protein
MRVNRIPEEIRDLLEYNPETGALTWKKWGRKANGGVAGVLNEKGYRRIEFKGIKYRAHRIAWFLYYGEEPQNEIDHINGCKSDNRICNLRLADQFQNAWNKKISKLNKSGIKGVHFHGRHKKWVARIEANKKAYHLGYFDDLNKAAIAIIETRKQLHKEFANFATNLDLNELYS